MKRCKDCEVVETPQGGRCADCRRAYQRAYREKRKKTHPEYFKHYYRENRERRRKEARDYWRERPAQNAERARNWLLDNPERARQTKAEYRAANPDKVRRWTAWSNWRRRNDPPDADALDYAELLRGDQCSYCGCPTEEIDHIEPLKYAGTNRWSNLTSSCRSCNGRKNARPLLLFLLNS